MVPEAVYEDQPAMVYCRTAPPAHTNSLRTLFVHFTVATIVDHSSLSSYNNHCSRHLFRSPTFERQHIVKNLDEDPNRDLCFNIFRKKLGMT